jgi:hypothetical protein
MTSCLVLAQGSNNFITAPANTAPHVRQTAAVVPKQAVALPVKRVKKSGEFVSEKGEQAGMPGGAKAEVQVGKQ